MSKNYSFKNLLKNIAALLILATFIIGIGCAPIPNKKTSNQSPSRLTHLKSYQAKKRPAKRTVSKKLTSAQISKKKKTAKARGKARKEAELASMNNDNTDYEKVELNKAYFKSFLTDSGNILTSPIRWNIQEWLTASLVVGITGGLMFVDEDIRDEIQENRSTFSDDLAKVGEAFGNGGYAVPSLGALYLAGHLMKNEKAKRAALLSFESFVISGAFTLVLKHSTGRARPTKRNESDNWEGPNFDGGVSFSSGHTATAFSIATIIANEYDNHAIVPPLAYGLATLTAWSRMNDNKHWASDVAFGAAMGYFTSKALLKYHEGPGPSRLAIMPMIGKDVKGVTAYYQF
ncbi:MAG: phosphatase PAP2 family protein [Nitrospinales bacterium]